MQKLELSEQKRREYQRAYKAAHPEKYAAAKTKYAATERGKEMKRTAMRAKRYGITREQMVALLEKSCAICGAASEHIDHNHATGKVRAALCGHCNKGLGYFRDNPEVLVAAAQYVKEHQ